MRRERGSDCGGWGVGMFICKEGFGEAVPKSWIGFNWL